MSSSSAAGQAPKKRRLRALAFGGGGFDTIMQLGVVHALLVSRGRQPEHVVGISAGAVNAAAVAEILQAGENLTDAGARRSMQVRRLRGFIDAYLELPRELLNSALPDTFEVNAKAPLKPVELPIHFQHERQSRTDAAKNKAGLIHLFNDILATRLTVSAATRIVRRVLGIKQAPELRRPIALPATILWNVFWLWLTLGRYAFAVSDLLFGAVYAAIVGNSRTLRRLAGSSLITFFKQRHWHAVSDFLLKIFGEDTGNAGTLINPGLIRRALSIGLRKTFALLLFLVIWLIPFRVIELPRELLWQVQRTVPAWTKIAGDTDVSGNALRAARAVANVPSASLDDLRKSATNAGHAIRRLLKATGRTAWNEAIPYRDVVAVPLLVLIIALILEVVGGIGFALGWLYLAALVIAGYSTHWFDRLLPAEFAAALLIATLLHPFLRRRVLAYYEIHDGLFSADVLRAYLVKCFDPQFYGAPDLDLMLDAALSRKSQVDHNRGATPALLSKYSSDERRTPIHVGPVAADVADGRLQVIDDSKPVIEALLAATSVVPLIPAQEQKATGTWLIDGLNVSNEPIQPLLDDLRKRYDQDPTPYHDVETVDIYAVSDLPVDAAALPSDGSYSTLIDVVQRALELKEFRDATMERRLTRLYTKALPAGHAFHPVRDGDKTRTFIHTGVFPIELEQPARVNRRLFTGDGQSDHFRTLLHETVADGCRASLEAMIPHAIEAESTPRVKAWVESALNDGDISIEQASIILDHPDFPDIVSAAESEAPQLIEGLMPLKIRTAPDRFLEIEVSIENAAKLRDAVAPRCSGIVKNLLGPDATLPGSDDRFGPGVAEICRNCRLFRPARKQRAEMPPEAGIQHPEAEPNGVSQRLRAVPNRRDWPQWPRESEPAAEITGEAPSIRHEYDQYVWPDREWPPDPSRPVISFLFGGGVFRGVYHVGVMNALNEMGLQPDLVAGSSVGAIIAAMIASVFKDESIRRKRRLLDLSATFLAIDRFVLTDRLADFIRKFTLRAAEAEFAARDLDRVLRRFDSDSGRSYEARLRRVAAGLERLFYFSPFELLSVVREFRARKISEALAEMLDDVQELLDRGGVGQEILGSEPLSFLIHHLVESGLPSAGTSDVPLFENFLEGKQKMFFLATTTNLSRGALEILGAPWNPAHHVSLEYGLLASSAFPGVFRPRHAWEIFRETQGEQRYVDGGVIDNLPLDAVARFLDEASRKKKVLRRPGVPHLLFTASLEIDHQILERGTKEVARAVKDCIELMDRAGTLKYNRKIDAYAVVQRRLRAIYLQFGPQPHATTKGKAPWQPLDLHVLAVKPNWLCNTFGFHPMLGFRRNKQAESIAHGCATTLATFHGALENHADWVKTWGASSINADPSAFAPSSDGTRTLLKPQPRKDGLCWFREGRKCPYAREVTEELNATIAKSGGDRLRPVGKTEIDELDKIYRACGKEATHKRR